jgi:hypothetical protein
MHRLAEGHKRQIHGVKHQLDGHKMEMMLRLKIKASTPSPNRMALSTM